MTTPDGELPPVGTFEHTLQVTTGLGPNLQEILDKGATPGKGWFIQAAGSLAPGAEQVDGLASATGFSYHAWDVWYVSVNRNFAELANWDNGVTEIDGMTGALAAANLGKIDVNYLINAKAALDKYIRWLASSHETLVQWASRIGANDSQFHGLAAQVITNRVIQLGQIVDNLKQQLTTDKSPPPSQALQHNADALYTFGREMSELWNEYSSMMHGVVETAMNAVVTNLYKYIVGMGLDLQASNPYVLDLLAEDGHDAVEAYIRSVVAGYHSDANTATEFSRDVRAISGTYQSEVVISESGDTRTFDRGELPKGMESFGGPLDSPTTWDLINSRISDYVRKRMAPLNERAIELLSNLAESHHRSKPAFIEVTYPDPPLGGENGGEGGDDGSGGNGGNGNSNQFTPPAGGQDDVNLGQQGDGESTFGPGGGDDRSNGQGNQAIVDPPPDGLGVDGQDGGPPPLGDGSGRGSNGVTNVNFATPGDENEAREFPNGGDLPGPGAAAADGSGSSNFEAGGGANGEGGRSFMPPPFMPPRGPLGTNGASGSRDSLLPLGLNNRFPGPGRRSDEVPEFADRPSIIPELNEDAQDSGGLDFQNFGPDSTDGIADAAVEDADDLLADQLAGRGGWPNGSVHVPGLTDRVAWNGGDFGALSEQDRDFPGDTGSRVDGSEMVLPAGGALGAPNLGESVFPGGGLDGESLGLGPDTTPIHAFDGQDWSEWSEDMSGQQVGDEFAGENGGHHARMPMMPIMPPGANQGKNQERQRLTWLSEDPEVWGTRSELGVGILGLPAETMQDPEEQRVATHVHAPVTVPRAASAGDVSGEEKDVGQGAAGNQRKDEA